MYDMPSDLQFKDDLRKQRDDWNEVLRYLEEGDTDKAKDKVSRVLKRINESLQD